MFAKNMMFDKAKKKYTKRFLAFLKSLSAYADTANGTEMLPVISGSDVQLMTTQQIADLVEIPESGPTGPLEYAATLSQTGTSLPTITVIQNDLGVSLTPTRSFPGFFQLTAPSAVFTTNKTLFLISNKANYTDPNLRRFLGGHVGGNTSLTITVSDATTLVDGFEAVILIRVYP